jgi:hypothetical protein
MSVCVGLKARIQLNRSLPAEFFTTKTAKIFTKLHKACRFKILLIWCVFTEIKEEGIAFSWLCGLSETLAHFVVKSPRVQTNHRIIRQKCQLFSGIDGGKSVHFSVHLCSKMNTFRAKTPKVLP